MPIQNQKVIVTGLSIVLVIILVIAVVTWTSLYQPPSEETVCPTLRSPSSSEVDEDAALSAAKQFLVHRETASSTSVEVERSGALSRAHTSSLKTKDGTLLLSWGPCKPYDLDCLTTLAHERRTKFLSERLSIPTERYLRSVPISTVPRLTAVEKSIVHDNAFTVPYAILQDLTPCAAAIPHGRIDDTLHTKCLKAVYYINCDFSTARNEAAATMLESWGLKDPKTNHRWEACTPKSTPENLQIIQNMLSVIRARRSGAGERACWSSFLDVGFRGIANRTDLDDDDWVLVLEDDAQAYTMVPPEKLLQHIDFTLNSLPPRLEVLWMARTLLGDFPASPLTKYVRQIKSPERIRCTGVFNAVAIAYKARFWRRLQVEGLPIDRAGPLDNFLHSAVVEWDVGASVIRKAPPGTNAALKMIGLFTHRDGHSVIDSQGRKTG